MNQTADGGAAPAAGRIGGLTLAGLTLDRIDARRVERFRFQGDGTVAATVGEHGGAVAAPLCVWRLDGDRLVIAASDAAPPLATLIDARREGADVLVVRGEPGEGDVRYRIDTGPCRSAGASVPP